jgi:hypothetical protein
MLTSLTHSFHQPATDLIMLHQLNQDTEVLWRPEIAIAHWSAQPTLLRKRVPFIDRNGFGDLVVVHPPGDVMEGRVDSLLQHVKDARLGIVLLDKLDLDLARVGERKGQ